MKFKVFKVLYSVSLLGVGFWAGVKLSEPVREQVGGGGENAKQLLDDSAEQVDAWFAERPQSNVEIAEIESLPHDKYRTYLDSLDVLSSSNLEEALFHYKSMEEGPIKYGALFMLLKKWASFDPDGAFLFGSESVSRRDREKLTSIAYSQSVKANPKGFVQQWRLEDDTELKEAKLLGGFSVLSSTDPLLCADLVNSVPEADKRIPLLQELMGRAGKAYDGTTLVLGLLGKFSGTTDEEIATFSGIQELSKIDVEAAKRLYSEVSEVSETRINTMPLMIREIAEKQGKLEAENWATSTLNSTQEADRAAAELAKLFMVQDYDKTLAWLGNIEDPELLAQTESIIERRLSMMEKTLFRP